MEPVPNEPVLNPAERLILLEIARRSVEASLGGGPFSIHEYVPTDSLRRPAGVFVTLRDRAGLRGCVGTLEARAPLYRAVASTAPEAALSDSRFAPLTLGELPEVHVELSVLGRFETVVGTEEIEVGRHGLVVRDGFRSGLLLPQVPGEFGWSRERFLDHLCLKAGLARTRWREKGLHLERFTAQVFSEHDENESFSGHRKEFPRAGE